MQHEAAAHLEATGQRTASGKLQELNGHGSHPPVSSPLPSGSTGISSAEELQHLSSSIRDQLAGAEANVGASTVQGSTVLVAEALLVAQSANSSGS